MLDELSTLRISSSHQRPNPFGKTTQTNHHLEVQSRDRPRLSDPDDCQRGISIWKLDRHFHTLWFFNVLVRHAHLDSPSYRRCSRYHSRGLREETYRRSGHHSDQRGQSCCRRRRRDGEDGSGCAFPPLSPLYRAYPATQSASVMSPPATDLASPRVGSLHLSSFGCIVDGPSGRPDLPLSACGV